MDDKNYYCLDSATGIKTFYGSIEFIKGKRNYMPSITADDPSVYERGFFKVEPGITERLRGDADEREFLQHLRP